MPIHLGHDLVTEQQIHLGGLFFKVNTNYYRASLVAQMVKNLSAMKETQVDPWVGKISWKREWLLTPVFLPGEFHGQRSLADRKSVV